MNLALWLRRLLLCTLALALPLQGLAATTMALCAGSVPMSTAQAVAPDETPPCHEAAASSAPADHACSLCTVCALVGALPEAPPTVPAVRGSLPPAAAPAAKVAPFVGDRLDRPPRARA